jgi:DNA-binding transcriptional ArsR family regulator
VNILISDKLSRSEMNVLQIMQEKEINCEERAVKIRTISEMSGMSYFSVRNIIKSFYVANLVCKSRRDGNAETYYLVEEKGE